MRELTPDGKKRPCCSANNLHSWLRCRTHEQETNLGSNTMYLLEVGEEEILKPVLQKCTKYQILYISYPHPHLLALAYL